MIRLPAVTLPKATREKLLKFQADVDGHASYPDRVEAADRLFKSRNSAKNPVFQVVRSKLHEMCSGARRCCYCEDSCADEVEHVRPKSLYPEKVFSWDNYLYACGPCNGPKNNQYAVMTPKAGKFVHVSRGKGDPVRPPARGRHAFIDPRRENPLDFMELDLAGTFLILPTAEEDTPEYLRAEYTIEVLRLNRDILPVARRSAFGSYKARLHEFQNKKLAGVADADLRSLVQGLRGMGHPTVWAEMKRQHALHAELAVLFDAVPEALEW